LVRDVVMSMPRRLETELLDVLPADDPVAKASRRDLRRVNRLMLSAPLVARRLRSLNREEAPPRRLLDLGAGDGTWMLALARHLSRDWPGVEVTLADRQDLLADTTREGFARLGWKATPATADVFAYLESRPQPHDIVVTNLFLHHFAANDMSRLLALVAGTTRLFIAVEPRRTRFPLIMSHLLWAIGCNRVTRHDAVASVRAGFAGEDISRSWPPGQDWQLIEEAAWPFSHCFIARHGQAIL
jgi:hypothetical protein